MAETLQCGPVVSDRDISANQVCNCQRVSVSGVVSAPTLVLMAGFAGAGKTTLAQKLHERFGWGVLDRDKLKYDLLDAGVKRGISNADWPGFVEDAGWEAFVNLVIQVRTALQNRESLIVDASNDKPEIFKDIKAIQKQLQQDNIHAQLLIVFCKADKATRTERVKKRGSVFAPFVKELPPIFEDSELPKHFEHISQEENVISVDTTRPLDENARDVVDRVELALLRSNFV